MWSLWKCVDIPCEKNYVLGKVSNAVSLQKVVKVLQERRFTSTRRRAKLINLMRNLIAS